ncbi:CidA/LrgA family protein [Staphylococcus gallinarum]|uniref:CidA/LrgA family protein n=2 Tax=Staphylococcus gallinarum TaxID=1293 RepID=A0A3A0VU78_STAGA|nr:CidA/LrgA family protein [Staphylococcus gallinarum]RIP37196.1 CidA/LrgA family protein [Staphylococcus gallinarum]
MHIARKVIRTLVQIMVIMGITYLGNVLQQFLHIPIAGSIVGLFLFFLLLQLKVIPSKWVNDGANFFLTFMVFFFIPSVVGVMDVVSEIDVNFILFFIMVIFGTCCVALISGFIAEKMVKITRYGNGQN